MDLKKGRCRETLLFVVAVLTAVLSVGITEIFTCCIFGDIRPVLFLNIRIQYCIFTYRNYKFVLCYLLMYVCNAIMYNI